MKRLAVFVLLLPALAYGGAKVSAFQKETKLGANYWNAGSAIDGKPETAWMVPGESPNRGEWIEFDVPKGTVDKLGVVIGFAKTDETFTDYPRLKQARVDIFSLDDDQNPTQVGTATVNFEDKPGMQVVDLPDTKVGSELFGGRLKVHVVDIYAGADYPNLAISEIQAYMQEFDATVKLGTVSGEGAGHPKDHALDTDVKTFWALPADGASFTLDEGGFGLSSVCFEPAADKAYARAKTVSITIRGNLTVQTVLQDKAGQCAEIPGFNGYNGGDYGAVEVKIVDTYPGTKPEIGISTLKVKATNLSAF
jgi:hypothetical protein